MGMATPPEGFFPIEISIGIFQPARCDFCRVTDFSGCSEFPLKSIRFQVQVTVSSMVKLHIEMDVKGFPLKLQESRL